MGYPLPDLNECLLMSAKTSFCNHDKNLSVFGGGIFLFLCLGDRDVASQTGSSYEGLCIHPLNHVKKLFILGLRFPQLLILLCLC